VAGRSVTRRRGSRRSSRRRSAPSPSASPVVFVPDHYAFEALGTLQAETPAYQLFFVLATLAQRTTRIRIGSHVACMLFRHSAMHARLFAQLDEASGGRVIAGVGAGWTRAEFEMMGSCLPKPVQRPGPPLMLGGSGNGILRRAGAWADIVHMVPVIGAAGTSASGSCPTLAEHGPGAQRHMGFQSAPILW
jgi:alkanesulfonate monooxygenase SsuD/methylene tetrahydromethanopterin reductase-like flavin-dependent oxidoreductase (luciferase family)